MPKYVKFPVADKLKETVKGFLDKWGIPQCAGSIDWSHIPVLPPTMNHTDYYNQKGFYSVNVQAVVDHSVLVNSALYSRCSSKEWLKGDTVRVGNSQLPTFLIGDSAYPLLPCLLKPFSMSPTLSRSQKTYNYRLCRGRVVVELAFGRLKARWRRLLKRNDMLMTNVPNVIAACCTLHNICEIHGDEFNDEWMQECESNAEAGTQPNSSNVTSTSSCPDGEEIREILINYFEQNPL